MYTAGRIKLQEIMEVAILTNNKIMNRCRPTRTCIMIKVISNMFKRSLQVWFHAWAQPLGVGGSGPPQNSDGPPTFYIAFLINRV